MRSYAVKAIGLLVASTLLLGVGCQIGYFQGMVDGKMAVHNGEHIVQKSIVQSVIRNDPDLSALEIDRHGDGNVVLRGELSREQVQQLESTLAEQFGAWRANLAVSEITESMK